MLPGRSAKETKFINGIHKYLPKDTYRMELDINACIGTGLPDYYYEKEHILWVVYRWVDEDITQKSRMVIPACAIQLNWLKRTCMNSARLYNSHVPYTNRAAVIIGHPEGAVIVTAKEILKKRTWKMLDKETLENGLFSNRGVAKFIRESCTSRPPSED